MHIRRTYKLLNIFIHHSIVFWFVKSISQFMKCTLYFLYTQTNVYLYYISVFFDDFVIHVGALIHIDFYYLYSNNKCMQNKHLALHIYVLFQFNVIVPSIAQLVERRTVVGLKTDILRSLVRIRFEGVFCIVFFLPVVFKSL